jgi:hypothetical protein
MTSETERPAEAARPEQDEVQHDYIDRSAVDFDPDEGLYSGTAVEGTSRIPGPHEQGPDTTDEDLAEENAEFPST